MEPPASFKYCSTADIPTPLVAPTTIDMERCNRGRGLQLLVHHPDMDSRRIALEVRQGVRCHDRLQLPPGSTRQTSFAIHSGAPFSLFLSYNGAYPWRLQLASSI